MQFPRKNTFKSTVSFSCGLHIFTLENSSLALKTQVFVNEKAGKSAGVPHEFRSHLQFSCGKIISMLIHL